MYTPQTLLAASENLGIKACDRDKSGVYIKVNEHFVEGSNAESGVFGGCLLLPCTIHVYMMCAGVNAGEAAGVHGVARDKRT